jgi:hypothetical protein
VDNVALDKRMLKTSLKTENSVPSEQQKSAQEVNLSSHVLSKNHVITPVKGMFL